MKKAICFLLSIFLLLNTGCFNYRDVNRIFFTLSKLVDIDENENFILYSENFKSYRGKEEKTGSEIRVVFTGIGFTAFDAYSNLARKASHEIDYSQLKALLFTENAAKKGISSIIEPIDRKQKLTLRTFLFVYEGDPEHYQDIEMKDEQFVGIFLDNLMASQGKVVNIPSVRFYDYLNKRNLGYKINIVPIIKNITGDTRERLEISGAAIFKNDKMIDKLSIREIVPYQLGSKQVKTGIITCPHPTLKDEYVSYQILRSNSKLSVTYDGNKVFFKKDINIKLSLIESTGPIDFSDEETVKKMKEDVRQQIKKDCFELFDKFQKKGIDLFNVQRIFEIKYSKVKIDDVLSITVADPQSDVMVKIEGGQDMINSN